jgi:4'-phosphopantetheinyl transferase
LSRDAARVSDASPSDSWIDPGPPPPLGEDELQVWYFPLVAPAGGLDHCLAVLSKEEKERANRFAFPHLRERYMVAHATLRRLLGDCLGASPRELKFDVADRGKPSLAGMPVHFNLSHTHDAGLVAVTKLGDVGIDIERIDRKIDRQGIADRFFSAVEAAELASLPEPEQAEGFFNLWTRKEAWLKATGVGISEGLNKVEFNCRPGEPARLLRIDGDTKPAEEWFVRTFRPSTRFARTA